MHSIEPACEFPTVHIGICSAIRTERLLASIGAI